MGFSLSLACFLRPEVGSLRWAMEHMQDAEVQDAESWPQMHLARENNFPVLSASHVYFEVGDTCLIAGPYYLYVVHAIHQLG